MTIFLYDKSFEGMLTCIFDAYLLKDFPEQLMQTGSPLPLFCDHHFTISTDKKKAKRIWKYLIKKISGAAIKEITTSWLSELPDIDILLFRYIHKAIDESRNIELNFADPDILQLAHIYKKVSYEGHRLIQFARFQKTADGTFFAPLEPEFNSLPLAINHFKDRFSDQKFLIYDMKRHYGYYYDLKSVTEVTLINEKSKIYNGNIDKISTDKDEYKYQQLWQNYFKTIAIKERINPRKQKQDMPQRYWKYLTEMK